MRTRDLAPGWRGSCGPTTQRWLGAGDVSRRRRRRPGFRGQRPPPGGGRLTIVATTCPKVGVESEFGVRGPRDSTAPCPQATVQVVAPAVRRRRPLGGTFHGNVHVARGQSLAEGRRLRELIERRAVLTLIVEGGQPIAPYAEAGLTWWIEAFGSWRGGLHTANSRIAEGPLSGGSYSSRTS